MSKPCITFSTLHTSILYGLNKRDGNELYVSRSDPETIEPYYSAHPLFSEAFFFSNLLLMYLARNYCYRINAIAPRPGVTVQESKSGQPCEQNHKKSILLRAETRMDIGLDPRPKISVVPSLGITSFSAFLGRGQLCQNACFYAHEYLLFRVEKNVTGQMIVRSICRYPFPAFAPESLKFRNNLYHQPREHMKEV